MFDHVYCLVYAELHLNETRVIAAGSARLFLLLFCQWQKDGAGAPPWWKFSSWKWKITMELLNVITNALFQVINTLESDEKHRFQRKLDVTESGENFLRGTVFAPKLLTKRSIPVSLLLYYRKETSEEKEKIAFCTETSTSETATLWGEKGSWTATFPKSTASEESTAVPQELETCIVPSLSKDRCSDPELAGHHVAVKPVPTTSLCHFRTRFLPPILKYWNGKVEIWLSGLLAAMWRPTLTNFRPWRLVREHTVRGPF